ncbi:hypothetical protein ACIRPX_12085 [Streptomyces sp. NPDC101225]|uniref:hypothetical protein n=1 Tax=Streptomyces sp. NPDC101225 TaxID=3366135 RepID=UPI0038236857
MSSDVPRTGPAGPAGPAPGALLLCRAVPESVAPAARLLSEPMLLTGAGDAWSVLVPEGRPWRDGGEPVDRVLTGWATALAVGAPWPVLALWWDTDRAGYTLASGFRRPVGYVWLANGTPAGEDEAMRTFASRLGLDPVLDAQALDHLTGADPGADAPARLRALLAVLTRAGVSLPAGLTPGEPADRLREVARALADSRAVDRPGRREADRTEHHAADGGRLAPRMLRSGTRGSRALSLAQVAAGLPLTVWGVRRRSWGWIAAGVLLLGHGVAGPAYRVMRPRD